MCATGCAADPWRMTSLVLPTPLDPPVRPSWSWGVWLAIGLGVVVEAAASFVAMLVVVWGASTTCNQVATASDMRSGETTLIVATCIGLAPWALAMIVSRRRLWLASLGLLSVTPLLYGISAGLDTQFWVGGFCF
jgi:hypothetical protein